MRQIKARLVALAAIIYHKVKGQWPPCRHCDIEYAGHRAVPMFQWGACDVCDWGNQ